MSYPGMVMQINQLCVVVLRCPDRQTSNGENNLMGNKIIKFFPSGVPLAVCVADGPVCLPPGGHRVHGHGQVDDVVPPEAEGLPLAPPRTPSHIGPLRPARTLHQVRRGHNINFF